VEAPTARDDTFRASLVPRDSLSTYWGYDVEVVNIGDALRLYDSIILTGKEGLDYRSCLGELRRLLKAPRVLVVFGSPRFGIDEILRSEGIPVESGLINFIPNQGVETVRTEEAVLIVLSVLRTLMELG
jgi:predicted SPOUT superfamily RNA methylase MTH1